jgi:hypothetical protein
MKRTQLKHKHTSGSGLGILPIESIPIVEGGWFSSPLVFMELPLRMGSGGGFNGISFLLIMLFNVQTYDYISTTFKLCVLGRFQTVSIFVHIRFLCCFRMGIVNGQKSRKEDQVLIRI